MITSTQNSKIKWVRALQSSSRQRREDGVVIAEGVRLAEEALAAGWKAQLVLQSDDLSERGRAVVQGFVSQGAPAELVMPQTLRAASDTETPQGILVVLAAQARWLPETPNFLLVLDAVRDPGNLGTIARTAVAAGVDGLICSPETTDPFSPKALRAGMGAQFRLPVLLLSWDQIVTLVNKLQVWVAAAGEGLSYDEADLTTPLAIIMGGEAEGAGEIARRMATLPIHIPMPGGGESLNVAVAAAVLLFEAARQRRLKKTK